MALLLSACSDSTGPGSSKPIDSILNAPGANDVTDVAARLSWQLTGEPVTKVKTFAAADTGGTSPLTSFDVDAGAQAAGEFIVTGLSPVTAYRIAIYSDPDGNTIRGVETYLTLERGVHPGDSNVVDLSTNEDPNAIINAVAVTTGGEILLLKKGVQYNLPMDPLDKSITIQGAYGFGDQKATLFTTGNWNIADGAAVDHVRFVDLELRGEDIGGDYVFNSNNANSTILNELTFDRCIIGTFRGIIRIRNKVFVKQYTINDCIIHDIGGYGVLTSDTDGVGNAAFDDIALTNSTFSKINAFMTSRQNAQSILIEACTLSEFAAPDGILFRWRGVAGTLSNVHDGITITNSLWGHAWDESMTGNLAVRGIYEGLEATIFTIVNTYATSDFGFTAGSEIPGFPSLSYGGTAADLWTSPYADLDFHFKDASFAGRFSTGDPRWRTPQ
jgi:hypothetical protein